MKAPKRLQSIFEDFYKGKGTPNVPKRHHSIFGDFYTGTEDLNLEERQALVNEVEAYNKARVPQKSTGTADLIVSPIGLVSAVVLYLSGNFMLAGLSALYGIFFLIRGLIRRYS